MNRIQKLSQIYASFISIPWRQDAAAAQRVIFCVYNACDERILRRQIDEFEIATTTAGHEWLRFDLDGSFAAWLSQQIYKDKYFQKPERLSAMMLDRYLAYILELYDGLAPNCREARNAVVALTGVAELFGFIKVKSLLDKLAPRVGGRLVVFFPGSYEGNNYRLMDAYDGWNYLAVPLTADRPWAE